MPARVLTEARDKFRSAVVDGFCQRFGLPVEKPSPGSGDFIDYSLVELCREALRMEGKNHYGRPLEVAGRALTTTDLPNILANVATVALMDGYETAPETFPVWTDEGSLPDFKESTLARASEADDLDEVPERGEYEYGDFDDKAETVQLATYGKIFAITRAAIINDNTAALKDIPFRMGRAAKRKIGDAVAAVLTANSAMGDGVTLFHADHGNVGTSAVVGTSSIAEGIKKMGVQTDPSGKAILNLRPHFFIGPKAIEGAAEVFFRSEKFSDPDTVETDSSLASTRANPYAGNYFTRVYDGRLDAASEAGWYLAGPKGLTVTVFYLHGEKTPYIESRPGWTVDGTEFKVRIDAAAKAVDWVGLVSNAGGA